MKPSSLYFGIKKIAVIIILLAVFLVAFAGVSFFSLQKADGSAQAAELGWQVFVKYRDGSNYHDLYTSDTYTKSGDGTRAEIYFFVSGWSENDAYQYTVVKEMKTSREQLDNCSWTEINPYANTTKETIDGIEYLTTRLTIEPENGISQDYYYFRRIYQIVDDETGITYNEREYYATKTPSGEESPIYWYITININNAGDNDFLSVDAKYLARGAAKETRYDGSWTANPITFTVVTSVMQADKEARIEKGDEGADYIYDPTKEVISYSDDFEQAYTQQTNYYQRQGYNIENSDVKRMILLAAADHAHWQYFGNRYNFISVSKSLAGVQMWFRVTDIGGDSAKFVCYCDGENGIEGNPVPIRLDPEKPRFEISATYQDESVGGGEEENTKEYRSGQWISTRARFTLALPADTKCISSVSFQYSVNNSGFMGLGGSVLEITETTPVLKFRAVTEAGQVHEYPSSFTVNIDEVTPQIRTEGFTIDPDDPDNTDSFNKRLQYEDNIEIEYVGEGESRREIRSVVTVYKPGNNKLMVRIYNRNSEGRAINNASGVTFEYQEASDRSKYDNTWRKMSDVEMIGNEKVYRHILSIGTEISLTKYVKFRLTSGAGLSSEIIEIKITVVNSVFYFDLLEENYLIAQYNQDGWIADKATIRAVVSVDKEENPTTPYVFYYWTEELTGRESMELRIKNQARRSIGRAVEFYDNKNGDILWIYEFDLVASANAFFNIRAMNAAEKLNNETRTTYDIIRIDVLEPTYNWDAYIYPSNLAEENISVDDLKKIDSIKQLSNEGKILKIADKDHPDAGWVDGSIFFVLAVNVGVSDVYLKTLEYAKKDNEPLYDQSGNLVWQENPEIVEKSDGQRNESSIYYYFFGLNNDNAAKDIVVNEYRYRAYTGSGISTDISFTAKFDATKSIRLKSATVTSESSMGENNTSWSVSSGSTVLKNSSYAVCDNFTLSFASSLDRDDVEDHYSLFYHSFTADDMSNLSGSVPTDTELLEYASTVAAEDALTSGQKKYLELTGTAISQTIEKDKQGMIYYAVYLKSKTRNWKNVSNYSGYYVVCVEYDTLNITIQYKIDALESLIDGDSDAEEMAAGSWRRGELEVCVTLPIDDKGNKIKMGDGYTYYYMLISFGSRGEIPDAESILTTGAGWIKASGKYNGNDEYIYTIPFTDASFYGYIGLSVCNKAQYRSIGYGSLKTIRIDNTTPDILGIIKDQTEGGLIERYRDEDSGKDFIAINTKDEISLDPTNIQADLRHSKISYYYKFLDDRRMEDILSGAVTPPVPTTEMTKLESRLSVFPLLTEFSKEKMCTVHLMIFAINEVATANTGFAGSTEWQTRETGGYNVSLTIIYQFNYDPSELTATALMPTTGSAEYGDSGMSEFLWQEKVGVSLTVSSSKRPTIPNYYRFMFSVDSGETWFDYVESGAVSYYTSDEQKEITFTSASLASYIDKDGNYPFENGVMETFRFRAINKAGTYVDCGSVFIAIDETVPEFEISMYDQNGLSYIGGNPEDLFSGDENWSNGPVTVSVNITRMPAAGVRVYYYLRYLNSNRSPEAPLSSSGDGKGKELVSYEQFTTDRLDGFNLNRDAILVLTVVSRSGGEEKSRTESVRISVDQQIPVFTLTGRAYEQNNQTNTGKEQIIVSGEWTGYNTVSVSKERSVVNVSPVVYTYTWQDETMAVPMSATWSETEANIERKKTGKLIVTATSANGDASKGKTYTVTFDINIDTTPPTIEFSGGINVIPGSEQYIDLQVTVHGDNLDIVEYITVKEDSRGFTFDPTGYVLSTSSVDNSKRHAADELDPNVYYRGYVHIYVRDKAGHEVHRELYILPFPLTVNTIQLTDEDKSLVEELEYTLSLAVAAGYMEKSRIEYFENLISRLHDRMDTLQNEIDSYRDYLEKLANRSSFELRSDYAEMFRYRQTFQNYEVYGQSWIQTAITGDSTSPYYAYYKNFLNQFDKLFALMEQVEKVQEHVTQLPAINMVEAEDYTDILRVYDEYYDLTQDQRSCFVANLYNKLMDLKEACEVLLLSDRETGVTLDGDFAPGATIAVTKYEESTDTYQNAQKLLMNSIAAEEARAIVSIHRVALTGAYAQTSASDIEVDLPIPEEYRSYIEFSVYSLADDGSMQKISGSKIQPDGASVKFTTPSLGTYVLCVKADIKETETNKDTYGSVLGIPLTATMIKYLLYIGGGLFIIIFVVCIFMGIRQRRFMNSYNRAYRNSIYRRQSRGVPKGNKFH